MFQILKESIHSWLARHEEAKRKREQQKEMERFLRYNTGERIRDREIQRKTALFNLKQMVSDQTIRVQKLQQAAEQASASGDLDLAKKLQQEKDSYQMALEMTRINLDVAVAEESGDLELAQKLRDERASLERLDDIALKEEIERRRESRTNELPEDSSTDERFELIAGEIIVKETQNKPHISAVWRTVHALDNAVGSGVTVLAQATLNLATDGAVEPDVMVISGGIDDSPDIPTQDDVLLIVEVSYSTLALDRGRKAAYYAEAGITDYWIVNLVDGCLEVRRNPVPAPDTPFGFAYSSRETFRVEESVSPLALPQASIAVSDLLPQRT